MPLLLEDDYAKLSDRAIAYEESEPQRFFIFTEVPLPTNLYTVSKCNVLVVIPQNYNQAGNDMLWTHPRLQRANGAQIPQTLDPGGGDNRVWKSCEYCRWSRHWNPPSPGVWRPGKDDVVSIYRRIEWSLKKPDSQ